MAGAISGLSRALSFVLFHKQFLRPGRRTLRDPLLRPETFANYVLIGFTVVRLQNMFLGRANQHEDGGGPRERMPIDWT